MTYDTEEFDDPVDLPPGVFHAGQTAYGPAYRCRCRYCVKWRRMYDQLRESKSAQARMVRRRGYLDYLAFRGIQVNGPGPFKRSPRALALIVAEHLGDDLDELLQGQGRLWR